MSKYYVLATKLQLYRCEDLSRFPVNLLLQVSIKLVVCCLSTLASEVHTLLIQKIENR